MSLCPIPGPAPVKSPLRELFDNPAYPVPAAVRKRAEFFLSPFPRGQVFRRCYLSDAGSIPVLVETGNG